MEFLRRTVGGGGTILHWNGTTGSVMSSGTTEDLLAAWGSAADDVWAVGRSGVIAHWNGTAWSSVDADGQAWFGLDLRAVWGSNRDDVWAVGINGAIIHWDGTRWTSADSGTIANLLGVWGSGHGSVCEIVGRIGIR